MVISFENPLFKKKLISVICVALNEIGMQVYFQLFKSPFVSVSQLLFKKEGPWYYFHYSVEQTEI